MSIVQGYVNFSRLYAIDPISVTSFVNNPGTSNDYMSLTGLSQVDASAVDINAYVNDDNSNGAFNADDSLFTTFPGDSAPTELTRPNFYAEYGPIANGYGAGENSYSFFYDAVADQYYILFSADFDFSRISPTGDLDLTRDGDAPGNLALSEILCFADGTMILTPQGPKYVESLCIGDQVTTVDRGIETIQWIGVTHISPDIMKQNPKHRPVVITAGSLGDGLPSRDLRLSRQHRVLVKSRVAERMFGKREVLIPAIKLTALAGVYEDFNCPQVSYYHILTNQHDLLFAEQLACESLYLGERTWDTLAEAHKTAIRNLGFSPDKQHPNARMIVQNKQAHKLVERMQNNQKELVEA